MSLDHLKLRTKSFIPLAVMALTVIAMVAIGALRLKEIGADAQTIIDQRDVAVIDLARATRVVGLVDLALIGALNYDEGSDNEKAAHDDFDHAPQIAGDLFDHAATRLPERAGDIQSLKQRLSALFAKAAPVYKAAQDLPGFNHLAIIPAEQLKKTVAVTRQIAPLDLEARQLIADVKTLDDAVIANNAAAAAALTEKAHNAVFMLIALGVVAALVAGGVSFWLTSSKIELPLKRLGERMRSLANGDLAVEIDGVERGDEIGDMAKIVQVFKAGAIDRVRIEREATDTRGAADTERERGAAERARASESQTAAMRALREGLRRLADGDLQTKLDQGFSAEFAEVREDFNAAAGKLKAALTAVAASTGAIKSSSLEISHASDNLSQRTEQQAASLEQTAAALEQITTTLKQSAQGAQHAADVVATADNDAKKGAVVVRKAVEAMDAIATSSTKIGQIIGVIDEIAFQTNLLALNAGVEAARAGDSGKGFAVVAMEVRALAQRSAGAAKEIKALVSNSGAQVDAGVKLVAETGKALESIIGQVSEINKVVADIASGAQQQATGLQQINAAISQMDQSTQQNATMVEESTAASHSLSQEMNELTRLVEQFRVGDADKPRRVADVADDKPRRVVEGGDKLRRDLKAIAPHAFAKPAPPPAPARANKPAVREAPRPKAVAASSTAANADWTEF